MVSVKFLIAFSAYAASVFAAPVEAGDVAVARSASPLEVPVTGGQVQNAKRISQDDLNIVEDIFLPGGSAAAPLWTEAGNEVESGLDKAGSALKNLFHF